MLIRRERPEDVAATRLVTAAAFRRTPPEPAAGPESEPAKGSESEPNAGPAAAPESAVAPESAAEPVEARLLDLLRASDAWIPALSLVAVDDADRVVGHVLGTRGRVDTVAAVAVGPVSVHPEQQRRGIGSALMHAVLAAAEALDEPLVALLGDPEYYGRFGFRLSKEYGIVPSVPEWSPYFQVRTLTAYRSAIRGTFHYAAPFYQL